MYRISVRPIKAPFLSTQGLANSLSVFSDEERMHFCTRADRIYLLTPTRVYTAFGGDEALVDPSLSTPADSVPEAPQQDQQEH